MTAIDAPAQGPRGLGILAASLALTHPLARAHPGHGLGGAHGHATDVFGFIAVLAMVGTVLWWRGRK